MFDELERLKEEREKVLISALHGKYAKSVKSLNKDLCKVFRKCVRIDLSNYFDMDNVYQRFYAVRYIRAMGLKVNLQGKYGYIRTDIIDISDLERRYDLIGSNENGKCEE